MAPTHQTLEIALTRILLSQSDSRAAIWSAALQCRFHGRSLAPNPTSSNLRPTARPIWTATLLRRFCGRPFATNPTPTPSLPSHQSRVTSHFFRPSTAFRVASIVNSSDSCGMLVTNGFTNHATPVGISRVSDTTSLCT